MPALPTSAGAALSITQLTRCVVDCRYQIVSLGTQEQPALPVTNAGWQVGDWVDTLLLPNLANDAVVRWIPGPVEVTGTGYYVLHCHLLPHTDEGCMMKVQLLEQR